MSTHVKMVGPVVRGLDGALADAVIEAIQNDNPDPKINNPPKKNAPLTMMITT